MTVTVTSTVRWGRFRERDGVGFGEVRRDFSNVIQDRRMQAKQTVCGACICGRSRAYEVLKMCVLRELAAVSHAGSFFLSEWLLAMDAVSDDAVACARCGNSCSHHQGLGSCFRLFLLVV